MIDFKRDKDTGDLVFENGTFETVSSTKENIIQRLSFRLRRFKGEYFLNVEKGIDYFNFVFIQSPDTIVIESLLKTEIMAEEGIEQILSFSSVYDNAERTLSCTFSAKFSDGSVENNITIEVF